LICHFDW
jgi:hypothetical protein